MPANLFINRLTDASILVSGSDDAMHKNLKPAPGAVRSVSLWQQA
ncbi:hypothetical protein ECEC1846_1470 [Escherichia coli EC1846]|uniref:Uncharacterized protein n=1 Tax=Escherichia coli EC1870 TaxID=1005554 RepID=A0AAV3HDN7_ECOLX|nr:hypothetical protein SS52_1433 [Escherichia coli O157:H7 str. SS52]EFW64386.1 hypothetical protein ECoD_03630 [Escherichia coli O157:H7 str. EC1212]EGD68519.1 hypothetical protein ECoA_01974 [Escherichia coli O157:H7 str. 1044]EHU74936.1 hypothetical protein ECDEC3C_1850 [Escherichia coli DEC3C]EHU81681.1 hypothetical protein ECDEC3E_1653 [Escherichia coli DEC3E]EHV00547.1 hypothetical protein ECDEC4B_1304 [Escherichia coli DEC4B]EHV11880.1 hypothetical protein ECDEC4D_1404 [Escherichia co